MVKPPAAITVEAGRPSLQCLIELRPHVYVGALISGGVWRSLGRYLCSNMGALSAIVKAADVGPVETANQQMNICFKNSII